MIKKDTTDSLCTKWINYKLLLKQKKVVISDNFFLYK